jgi:hypothetical protein
MNRVLLLVLCQPGRRIADVETRHVGNDRAELAADLFRRLRLGVETSILTERQVEHRIIPLLIESRGERYGHSEVCRRASLASDKN